MLLNLTIAAQKIGENKTEEKKHTENDTFSILYRMIKGENVFVKLYINWL